MVVINSISLQIGLMNIAIEKMTEIVGKEVIEKGFLTENIN